MNNNMQELYCSIEVSKLLKEKGCGVNSNKNTYVLSKDIDKGESAHFTCFSQELEQYTDAGNDKEWNVYRILSIPTHALAIEWIKQNYGSDKIKHITYDWTSEQIDNELILILQKCGNQ